MLAKLVSLLPDKNKRNVAFTVAGMTTLLTGQKIAGLSMVFKGLRGIEAQWREAHPDFDGDLAARWEEAITFYEDTHSEPTNRKLHVVGIPMVLGGAAGLLIFRPFRPFWFASASSFAAGWGLNIVGHFVFEKNAPAFADDPLSFIAGPVWDLKHGGKMRAERMQRDAAETDDDVLDIEALEINVASGEPAVA
ncbi:MAG: DUF962 domain-containing protein [Deltaproteobacteria bacterium]|nr:DUF962 domain-containing protein [Deltaproteobacteria bacterium]